MARVTLAVPPVLRESAGGRAELDLEADRLDRACERIRREWPNLATHLFEGDGRLRPHVLLLHNDRLTRGRPAREIALAAGDRLEIVQAVSGG